MQRCWRCSRRLPRGLWISIAVCARPGPSPESLAPCQWHSGVLLTACCLPSWMVMHSPDAFA
eukprot:11601887-Alexandrium_andersonii.AAC.1